MFVLSQLSVELFTLVTITECTCHILNNKRVLVLINFSAFVPAVVMLFVLISEQLTFVVTYFMFAPSLFAYACMSFARNGILHCCYFVIFISYMQGATVEILDA